MKMIGTMIVSLLTTTSLFGGVLSPAISEAGRGLAISYYTGDWEGPIEVDGVSMQTTSVQICGDAVAQITEVELWMPDHGHGSFPTKLASADSDCINVDSVEFTMPGVWELKTKYEDGDMAVFTVQVAR